MQPRKAKNLCFNELDAMSTVIPILRIFDYDKAIEFYVNWLGFKLDWKDEPENTPVYLEISFRDIVLNLSEHHGDACPGSTVRIVDFKDLSLYHEELIAKNYKYNRPGLGRAAWDANTLQLIVNDPFGNRLMFYETLPQSS
jgi:catechol 2,3-dioxygenase-like lactoylglutathione lyase family enzyme